MNFFWTPNSIPKPGDPWPRSAVTVYTKPRYKTIIVPKVKPDVWIYAKQPKKVCNFLQTIELTGKGNTLVYDSYGGRWFRSSYKAVKEGCDFFLEQFFNGEVLSYSDWYMLQGISPSDFGYKYGYSPEESYQIEPSFVIEYFTAERFNRNCDWKLHEVDEDVIVVGPDPRAYPTDTYCFT